MAFRPTARYLPRSYQLIPAHRRSLASLSTMSRLTADDLNPAIRNVQYAVRGELAIKAEQYRVELRQNSTRGLPFSQIISSNIGNPQQKGLDQPPLSFVRQVCLFLPRLCCSGTHRSRSRPFPGSRADGVQGSQNSGSECFPKRCHRTCRRTVGRNRLYRRIFPFPGCPTHPQACRRIYPWFVFSLTSVPPLPERASRV
jgi:hypothetical protein